MKINFILLYFCAFKFIVKNFTCQVFKFAEFLEKKNNNVKIKRMKWKTNIINLNFQLITFPKMTSRWLFTIIFLFEAEHILILLPITIFTCELKF